MTKPALTLSDFDPSVRPQDDLYRHVNGGWLKTAEIPADRSSWGSFMVLREEAQHAVRQIIEGCQSHGEASADSAKIARLYASFMNEDAVEAKGVQPLRPLLGQIDAIESAADLARWWGWAARHGINSLGDADNEVDPGDPDRYLMFFGQSGIGLPDEEYYRLDQHAGIRARYLEYVTESLTLAGVADAPTQARNAVDLETRIAACHWDKVRTRDMVEMYCPQSWDEFTAASPGLAWDAFLEGAEIPRELLGTVVNCQRTFFTDAQRLVESEPLAVWQSWARWQLVNSLSAYLNKALVNQQFEFYSKTLQGVPELRARWKRGVSLTEGVLGDAIGRLYIERHFPPVTKSRADELVSNLLEAYRRSISSLDWMSEPTRVEALQKLSKFRAKIGYPDKWHDYSTLTVQGDDLIGNVLRADSFEFDHALKQLSGPVDRDEWFMFPQTVNAYYHPLRNEVVFPAAILQPPFFNVHADDAVNYGGIGAVIGHEIGHGFDDQGSTCDGDGRLRDWWTEADREAFEERTRALVDQYGVLSPSEAPEVTVNGELTLGENIGDLGGLSIAHQAWRISLEGRAEPAPIDGYTGSQRFFLSWAACWQDKTRPEAMRERVATDPHSPDEIRCNQTARNVDAFHEAFSTTPSDELWLAPQERVQIW